MNYTAFEQLCREKGTTPTAITEKIGLKKGNTTKWKNGGNPSIEILLTLSVELECTVDYLLTGKEKSPSISLSDDEQKLLGYFKELSPNVQQQLIGRAELLAEQAERSSQITCSCYIADVAAGAGISAPFTIDDAFSPRQFNRSDVPSNADCGVPINGDSMEPKYPHGCIVWVKRNAEVKYGDTVIAVRNGEPLCKIYKQDGLYSYNQKYNPIRISEDDSIQIFGKVIGFYTDVDMR